MRRNLLFLVLAAQVLWLLGSVWVQEQGLNEGTRVQLETAPVDPRDLLRGDYVILSYKISRVPPACFVAPPQGPLTAGTTVWVLLEEQENGFYGIAQAGLSRLSPGPGQVLLRGSAVESGARDLRLEYGLERYYVREGTGNPQGRLTVEASIDSAGVARIAEVYVDGVRYREAMGR